ncbi:MAG: DUF6880 family protein [Pseudomonadota bacterium]
MAGKSLNKTNLEALGADVLAELLMEAVKGDAARQRRVRMALSSEQSLGHLDKWRSQGLIDVMSTKLSAVVS